jgi:hypothetical protein
MNKIFSYTAIGTLALLLGSCSASSDDIRDINNQVLDKSAYECKAIRKPPPGYAVACGNIQRECQRRSELLGYKLC